MKRLSEKQPISRRVAVCAGALTACWLLSGGTSTDRAHAGIIASWSFPSNANLSPADIAERFDRINRTYDAGEPFSDEDIDFVLRYAATQLEPGTPAIAAELEHGEKSYQMSGSSTGEYEGDFSYRYSTVLQAGSRDSACRHIAIWEKRVVYGWEYPFTGGSFGILARFDHEAHREASNWFTAEFNDELGGIVAGMFWQCGAHVATSDGQEIEMAWPEQPPGRSG